ncbi:uncharacterized protein PRCAT00004141001 [Priceomyces carsonii]|uniref:uncharacterized protein n=1 Tax=Priceomyces carsonii TaxID=28549 RepID=UPI002ED7D1CD|nr:unnamed protein product [Priceomyces carsonii]
MKCINETVTIGHGNEYEVLMTISNRPWTIYVNRSGNKTMGSYVFSINDPSGDGVFSTTLYSGGDEDMVRSICQILVKKFKHPVYLNISGSVNSTENLDFIRTLSNMIRSI